MHGYCIYSRAIFRGRLSACLNPDDDTGGAETTQRQLRAAGSWEALQRPLAVLLANMQFQLLATLDLEFCGRYLFGRRPCGAECLKPVLGMNAVEINRKLPAVSNRRKRNPYCFGSGGSFESACSR